MIRWLSPSDQKYSTDLIGPPFYFNVLQKILQQKLYILEYLLRRKITSTLSVTPASKVRMTAVLASLMVGN
jgi:hypothetical protein